MERNSIFILIPVAKFCIEKMFHNVICIHQSIWCCCCRCRRRCCGLHSSCVQRCVRALIRRACELTTPILPILNQLKLRICFMSENKWISCYRFRDISNIPARSIVWCVLSANVSNVDICSLVLWQIRFRKQWNVIANPWEWRFFPHYSTWARTRAFKVSKDYFP